MKPQPRVLVLAISTVIAVPAAHASPLDLYGGSPQGLASDGAMTATSEDGLAAFFNPAGLGIGGSKGKFEIQIGYMYAAPELFIQPSRPTCPGSTSLSAAVAGSYPCSAPTVSQGYIVGSVLLPLGGPIKHMASFGVFFALPQDNLLNANAVEPVQPQWIRYGTESDHISVGIGLGVRPLHWLSVGLGVQEFAAFTGGDSFQINTGSAATATITDRNIGFGLDGAAAPTAGITFIPMEGLHLAFGFRGALDLQESLPDTASIPNIEAGLTGMNSITELNINSTGTLMYSPPTLSWGASWEQHPWGGLKLGVDIRYELWNQAPVPDFNVDISVASTSQLVQTFLSDLNGQTVQAQPRFVQTVTPTATVEYSWQDHRYIVQGAYSYRPTYIQQPGYVGSYVYSPTVNPNTELPTAWVRQSGPAAEEDYLDAGTHIIGIGGTVRVYDNIGLFPNGLDIDIGYQMQIVPRTTESPSHVPAGTTPEVGSLSYGGVVFAAGAALRTRY